MILMTANVLVELLHSRALQTAVQDGHDEVGKLGNAVDEMMDKLKRETEVFPPNFLAQSLIRQP